MKQPDLCTCSAQLQPHDPLPNVCPVSRWDVEPQDEGDEWRDLGGEG